VRLAGAYKLPARAFAFRIPGGKPVGEFLVYVPLPQLKEALSCLSNLAEKNKRGPACATRAVNPPGKGIHRRALGVVVSDKRHWVYKMIQTPQTIHKKIGLTEV